VQALVKREGRVLEQQLPADFNFSRNREKNTKQQGIEGK
jgi:hypothetical protein